MVNHSEIRDLGVASSTAATIRGSKVVQKSSLYTVFTHSVADAVSKGCPVFSCFIYSDPRVRAVRLSHLDRHARAYQTTPQIKPRTPKQ